MFRVTIRGKFGELDAAQRSALSERVDALDVGFTPDGAFTCDRSLSVFSFRCEIPVQAETDGEREATERATERLLAHGYPATVLRTAVTDMCAIKIRRKS